MAVCRRLSIRTEPLDAAQMRIVDAAMKSAWRDLQSLIPALAGQSLEVNVVQIKQEHRAHVERRASFTTDKTIFLSLHPNMFRDALQRLARHEVVHVAQRVFPKAFIRFIESQPRFLGTWRFIRSEGLESLLHKYQLVDNPDASIREAPQFVYWDHHSKSGWIPLLRPGSFVRVAVPCRVDWRTKTVAQTWVPESSLEEDWNHPYEMIAEWVAQRMRGG